MYILFLVRGFTQTSLTSFRETFPAPFKFTTANSVYLKYTFGNIKIFLPFVFMVCEMHTKKEQVRVQFFTFLPLFPVRLGDWQGTNNFLSSLVYSTPNINKGHQTHLIHETKSDFSLSNTRSDMTYLSYIFFT